MVMPGEQEGVHNVFSGQATYVIQARDVGDIHFHGVPGETPQDRAARELARVVHAQWRDEAGMRGLSGTAKLAVRWVADWGLADHRQNVGGDLSGTGNGLADLAAAFRALPERRLVILGGPGAGKTSLAVMLTLELLRTRGTEQPVPVILLAASWDPRREHFDTWLARRVREEYAGESDALDRQRIRELVRDRRLIPVVDGLDELPQPVRAEALTGLNRALTDGTPLILTSRTAEYAEVVTDHDVLRSAAVIRAQPVPAATAAEHLRATSHPQRSGRWEPVLTALADHPDGPLATALSSPLMLWLARTAYGEPTANPAELVDEALFPDPATIERHLLDALIPAVFRTGPPSPDQPRPVRDWGPDRARRWLGFLAAHLTRLHTRELGWWELHRAKLPSVLKAPVLIVTYFLLMWAMNTLTTWYAGSDPFQAFTVAVGSTMALMFGLMGGMIAQVALLGKGDLPRRPARLFGRRRAHVPGPVALIFLLAPLVMFLLRDQPALALGLTLPGLLVLLVGMPGNSARVAGPRALLRGEQASTVLGVLLVSPAVGAIAAAFIAPIAGLPSALGTVLVGGAGATAVVLLLSPWSRWLLAKVALAGTGRLPWSVLTFLEDARRAGVLRQVGGVYQFRHARLQARLAATSGIAEQSAAPVTSALAPEEEPQAVRFHGYTGMLLRRGQPRNYVLPWSFALIWIIIITTEHGWGEQGAWLTVGFFVILPLILDLVAPPTARRRAEMYLDRQSIRVTTRRRHFELPWSDVAQVAVRDFEPPIGGPRSDQRMLHLRLSPTSAAGRRIRVNRSGWFPIWSLGEGPVPPELEHALARFAGERWTPPEPDGE
ncbi:NACHT domain-containing protein [Planosporangium mesophilum]|uniref:NACHT domain-containing protein n=1 Tax=Planosporangium mesophilum TaxID=689768 RepID=A0A8J3T5X4_9ACTN|nr:NACHT domain-containing protein [Planosporangium mesophilum]NJC81235.1 NACHT domain-containing protein [Planosporangium mesophilum]GII21115.1 hypothetical protein Pme01_07120 [Planosporangium mesophilum]